MIGGKPVGAIYCDTDDSAIQCSGTAAEGFAGLVDEIADAIAPHFDFGGGKRKAEPKKAAAAPAPKSAPRPAPKPEPEPEEEDEPEEEEEAEVEPEPEFEQEAPEPEPEPEPANPDDIDIPVSAITDRRTKTKIMSRSEMLEAVKPPDSDSIDDDEIMEAQAMSAEEAVPVDVIGAVSTRTLWVLLVQENAMIRPLLASQFRKEGWAIAFAKAGEQAIKALATDAADLIVIDASLPGELGSEGLIEVIRLDPRLKKTPLVVIATGATVLNEAKAKKLGADDFVVAPQARPTFASDCRALVDRKRGG
jgi:CheY-like chemotaxis protein